MVQKKTSENERSETTNNGRPAINRTFEQELVVLLQTRLEILKVQKEISKELKMEAPTISQEKALYLDVVRYNAKIEEIMFLIKIATI